MPPPLPPLFHHAPAAALGAVDRLFFDVDDTLTWKGRLPPEAIAALHDAHDAGISLVAVTGRSLAWAEMLLRLFPLDAAIGETGAACLYWRKSGETETGSSIGVLHAEPDANVRRDNQRRRDAAADAVFAAVPRARFALDNMGRVYDTAFDLVEDGPALAPEEATEIRSILADHGLVVAQSSVHINAWFGDFDKASMVSRYLEEVCQTSLAAAAPSLVYVGDSTNDGPMFARSPLSVGVNNVTPHLEALDRVGQRPKFLVAGDGGAGFAEVVSALRRAKSGSE